MEDVLRDLPPALRTWVECGAEDDGDQGGVVICCRPAGHDGDHADFTTGKWWPRP